MSSDMVALRCLRPGCTVAALSGEIDLLTAGQLRDDLRALPAGDVILEVSGVGFLGACGLRTLMELQAQRNQEGARVVLAAAPRPILRVLDAAGCSSVFEVAACVDIALKLIDRAIHRAPQVV